MTTVLLTMRKRKEILRLKYDAKLTHRQIAKRLSISPGTVSRYSQQAAQQGLTQWPLPDDGDEARLKSAFQHTSACVSPKPQIPDWSEVHQELRAKCMTLALLWQEYQQRHTEHHYSYSHYCRCYRDWLSRQNPSMRQRHKAGEKLFVDYCGPTVPIVTPKTGEIHSAHVFVAVLGASNYTFAEATRTQQLEDWVMSHARAFTFFGGVPSLVVPDNLKSGVSKACRYEPDLNPTYQQLAAHYGVAVMPARPIKPKDKAKAEVGVQIIERWILACLRHETFFSLAQLNQRISELLARLNQKPFKKLEGCRETALSQIDKPALKPLPLHPYEFIHVTQVRVHIDYHVEIQGHYYSVPYTLIKQRLDAHTASNLVRLYHGPISVLPNTHAAFTKAGSRHTKTTCQRLTKPI